MLGHWVGQRFVWELVLWMLVQLTLWLLRALSTHNSSRLPCLLYLRPLTWPTSPRQSLYTDSERWACVPNISSLFFVGTKLTPDGAIDRTPIVTIELKNLLSVVDRQCLSALQWLCGTGTACSVSLANKKITFKFGHIQLGRLRAFVWVQPEN